MRRIILGAMAALLLGSAALATPAEARCFWNGFETVCVYHPHHWGYWHSPYYWDRPYYRDYGYGYWR